VQEASIYEGAAISWCREGEFSCFGLPRPCVFSNATSALPADLRRVLPRLVQSDPILSGRCLGKFSSRLLIHHRQMANNKRKYYTCSWTKGRKRVLLIATSRHGQNYLVPDGKCAR